LETFVEPKALVENRQYHDQRRRTLASLSDGMIDFPIIELIHGFNKLPYCFTLQSCYGHFIFNSQTDPHNLEPLPLNDTITRVEYRIAYLCLCVENSDSGRSLLHTLQQITAVDPANIQFCCATWFWKRHVNSYALQVEPDRFKHQDSAILEYQEALQIETIRYKFFEQLREMLYEIRCK